MPDFGSWAELPVQIILVGIFIWYSLQQSRHLIRAYDLFTEALEKRDKEYDCRNHELAQAIERRDVEYEKRNTAMIDSMEKRNQAVIQSLDNLTGAMQGEMKVLLQFIQEHDSNVDKKIAAASRSVVRARTRARE